MARANEYVFRGSRLADALEWQAALGSVLAPLQQSFLDASRALQEAEQRAANRRTRITIGTLVGVVLFISALALFALAQQHGGGGSKGLSGYSAQTAVAQSTEAAPQPWAVPLALPSVPHAAQPAKS
jgi:hypothetical protein